MPKPRSVKNAIAALRMRLRRPSIIDKTTTDKTPPTDETPHSDKTPSTDKAPLSEEGNSPSKESDVVVTARMGNKVTIATAAITALLGLGGSIATAAVSCQNTGRQLASDREKSTTEFLRNQRRTAYATFAADANTSYLALLDATDSIGPRIPPPAPEVFDKTSVDLRNHLGDVSVAGFNVELVASEEVCEAASRESRALWDAAGDHFWRAYAYIHQRKPMDSDYGTISMTVDQINTLRDMFIHFVKVAREDINDSALRPPGKDCPKASWRQ